MTTTTVWTRREAVKVATIAASAALLPSLSAPVLAEAAQPASATQQVNTWGQPDPVLLGVSDMHIHAAPDTRARSVDELTLAREARDAGYRSVMFKSNHWACHDRAWLVSEALRQMPSPGAVAAATTTKTDFHCFGSLCMNRVHGDTVNVHAAEQAVNTTGKLCRCIWMPTQDAAYQHAHEKRPGKGIAVVSDSGVVLPEVIKVMEICAEAGIVFATGHSSPDECLILARAAKNVGVDKFVVTHANSLIWKLTRDQILRLAECGAFIEYSYLTCLWGGDSVMTNFPRMSNAEFVDFARIIPERTVITTDLGQVNMPHPLEGMRQCIAALREGGISPKDVDSMTRTLPARLLGLPSQV